MTHVPALPSVQTLVTGATGFLGSHLVDRLLAAGCRVRIVARNPARAKYWTRNQVEVIAGDVTDAESLQRAAQGCQIVYHLAAHVSDWGPWEKFEKTTVQGTANLLAACRTARVERFVLASTALVYDDRHARRARIVAEDAPLLDGDRAYGHYSKAKVLAEEIAWRAHRAGEVAVTAIRPTWIYGPRDATILPRLLEHYQGPLSCWIGRTDPSCDPVFVTDVADAALLAAHSSAAAGEAFNVSPTREVRLREFLGALFRQFDIRPPRVTVPYSLALAVTRCSEAWARLTRATTPPEMTMAGLACITVDQHIDSAKAQNLLQWRPQVALEEGARLTAEWIRTQATLPA
ncbi:MAG: SDR family NAD(P)-dependent oxidoreductase [Pirellulales bacterium]